MLKLERVGNEVYCEGRKLTIVPQTSKGANKEVVKIEGLEGSNGKKWLSLSKLVEGENIFNDQDLVAREVSKGYELTKEEQEEVDSLTNRITEIIENAKKRYVKPIKKTNINDMSKEELEQHIAHLQSLLNSRLN